MFASIPEIQEAVKAGHKVHWKNPDYVVSVDMLGQWHIGYRPWSKTPNYVGLVHKDGITSDYDPAEFFLST